MKYFILIFCLLLCGCEGPNNPNVLLRQRETLSQEGQFVGKLPDGRKVYRWELDRGTAHNHFIYVVDDTVTLNQTIDDTVGENHTTHNQVEVTVNKKGSK